MEKIKQDLLKKIDAAPVIHIIGMTGTEGESALKFLAANTDKRLMAHDFSGRNYLWHSYRKAREFFSRSSTDRDFQELMDIRAELKLDQDYLSGINKEDIILLPQDWDRYPANKEAVKSHSDKGGTSFLIFDLYYLFFKGTIIGVTGTKGKTTSCHLACNLLKNWGKKAYISGNDRYSRQALPVITSYAKESYLILETSNRHLKHTFFRPHIAMLTNIDADHLEEHDSDMEKYAFTKLNIFGERSCAILPLEIYQRYRDWIPSRPIILFSTKAKDDEMPAPDIPHILIKDDKAIARENDKLCTLLDISKIESKTHTANILLISGLAYMLKIPSPILLNTINSRLEIRSRLEYIGNKSKIQFIDDLSATTPFAAVHAIESIKDNIILICGGDTKGNDYNILVEKLNSKKVKRIYLLHGPDLEKSLIYELKDRIRDLSKLVIFDSFKDAFFSAYSSAEKGDTILLSPASAYFYSNFIRSAKNSMRVLFKMLKTR